MGLNLKKMLKNPKSWVGLLTGGVGGAAMMGSAAKDARKSDQGDAAAKLAAPGATVPKAVPGGMADYYDDSWKPLLEGMQQGQGTEELLQQLLANFKGKPGNLEDFLRQAAPFIASAGVSKLGKSQGLKHMENPANWDLGALGGYGAAAGMIGQGATRSIGAANQQMAAAGLGRSSGRGAMTGALQQQAYGQQAGLWADANQMAQRNRMQSATNLFDAHRTLAQLAMGQVPSPRMVDSGPGGSGMAGSIGAIASGVGAGAAIGGPIGGVIGGLAGGGASLLGKK